MSKKRARESRGLSFSSKKRQKLEKTAKGVDDSDGLVEVDDLDWKAVSLPDRLDDAGGFFGLEEIEGVEVVRPAEGKGQVKFKVRLSFRTADWIYLFFCCEVGS